MQLVKLDTGFNIEVEFAISPFHKRFFAWLIDAVIQYTYLIFGARIYSALVGPAMAGNIWPWVLFLLPYIFYHLICEVTMNGKSIGKMVIGIKVMTEMGGDPSLSQYLIRWLFRIIDFPVLVMLMIISNPEDDRILVMIPTIFAGLLCVILTPRSQRIGDLVAGTILIDLKTRTSWEDTVFTEVEATYQPRYPQVMQLSDRDINTLKSIIETVKRKGDYELAMRISDRIKSKLKMESDQESLDFLQTLLKDYNYYSTN
jgi:uncharacterized RDD family membrane protein YckC